GRYRMLADVRGWLHRRHGLQNFTSKPYDVASLLVWREAGVPVLGDDFAPLDAPMDTETKLSVIAFPNEELRARLEPRHRARRAAGRRLRASRSPPAPARACRARSRRWPWRGRAGAVPAQRPGRASRAGPASWPATGRP